ncbi:hypothetical protein J4E80_010599 [Alternaria sp. BMP 0032]|nr:hypothetical protein J4E80_010599 [Alternaria sp. BMP 0032]
MCMLLLVQLVAVTFDVTIVFMDFAGYLQLKFGVFSFAYAVKLELEIVALNQLVELNAEHRAVDISLGEDGIRRNFIEYAILCVAKSSPRISSRLRDQWRHDHRG